MIFPNVPHSYHTLSAKGNTQLNIINSYLDLLPLHKKLLLSMFPSNPVLAAKELHPDILFAEKRLFTLQQPKKTAALISSFLSLILCRLISSSSAYGISGTASSGHCLQYYCLHRGTLL